MDVTRSCMMLNLHRHFSMCAAIQYVRIPIHYAITNFLKCVVVSRMTRLCGTRQISPTGDKKDTVTLSSTCRSRAIDSLGMISFRPKREMKHRAWYWFCPRSNSPRIRARKILTSCGEHGIKVFNRTRSSAKHRPTD